jgi:hypothetical protein
MDGACNTYGKQEKLIQGFGGESCWKERTLGRTRRRRKDNIKMDLQLVGCGGVDWIDVGQDRDRWRGLVNAVMKIWFP